MADRFRSTWLSSSLRALRERGLFEKYFEHLPSEYHETMEGLVAGMWLPIKVAVAHYEACDRLGLSVADQVAMGASATGFTHGTVLDTIVRAARTVGVTPWVPFSLLNRLWMKIWVGGGVGVFKLGPREARIEIVSWPCSRVPYCRVAMRGVLHGITQMFCRRCLVRELPSLCTSTSLGYHITWV